VCLSFDAILFCLVAMTYSFFAPLGGNGFTKIPEKISVMCLRRSTVPTMYHQSMPMHMTAELTTFQSYVTIPIRQLFDLKKTGQFYTHIQYFKTSKIIIMYYYLILSPFRLFFEVSCVDNYHHFIIGFCIMSKIIFISPKRPCHPLLITII